MHGKQNIKTLAGLTKGMYYDTRTYERHVCIRELWTWIHL